MSAPSAPSVRRRAADAITYHPGNRAGTPDARDPVSVVLADAVLQALGVRDWQPADGDERCQRCGRENPCWYAPDEFWNGVMDDQAEGVLCPTCFLLQAQVHHDRGAFRVEAP
jgi:hypothetical protein